MIPTVLKELIALASRKRKLFRVAGTSMAPVLEPKDIVFIRPTTECHKDDIVAIRHPHKKTILIKYVKEIDENNLVELSSPTGTDSKEFGKAALKHLIGVATYNYSQKKSLIRGNNFS
ncbi:MAG: S24 family peptidase [Actinomycetota bacterium]|nr:S24 family peptidase [Actinomycetota bacterium]MEC7578859.1 S24 family peptidase [Actinomycetota bacterium]MEC9210383.1 S24 family peptidase [Actinomycetota bacterium]